MMHVRDEPKAASDFSADASALMMAGMLQMEEPFTYIRYGDGALECIYNKGRGRTCDGEVYSSELGLELYQAWRSIMKGRNVYPGDWLSAAFNGRDETRYPLEWDMLKDGTAGKCFLHFEALLLHRESLELQDFYRAARNDKRRKVYVGPYLGAAKLLGSAWFYVPLDPPGGLFSHINDLSIKLKNYPPFDVLYWSAGMAGSILVARDAATHPERTYINLGSALDPLFRGRSRSQQISPERAQSFMREFL